MRERGGVGGRMADERKKRMSGRRRNVDRNNRRKLEGGGYVRVYILVRRKSAKRREAETIGKDVCISIEKEILNIDTYVC